MNKALLKLSRQINGCKKCSLHKNRNRAVPGEGGLSYVMLIGQAPGKEEDIKGRPFVGRAGKFLDYLLKKNKIDRKKCYITSVVKCFPPKNRAPKKEEAEICVKTYLIKQIELVNPKTIVLMGRIAKRYVPKEALECRKVVFTHHPAAGMRFPAIRKKMIADFKRIK